MTVGSPRIQDVLDRAYAIARSTEPDLTVTTAHTTGRPVPALLDAAGSAELLVVGMAARDRTEELLLGSVALDVSGRAGCPVAVVRGEHRLPGGDGPVLVGVDTAVDDAALTVAFDDARRHRSRLVVLHVRRRTGPLREDPAGQEAPAHVAARNLLLDELAPWADRYPDVPVDVEVVRGNPARAVLAAAVGVRVVVVGTRGRHAPARVVFGSTSREVLRRSTVPVIVVSPAVGARGGAAAQAPAAAAAAPTGQASARTERDHPHDPDRLW